MKGNEYHVLFPHMHKTILWPFPSWPVVQEVWKNPAKLLELLKKPPELLELYFCRLDALANVHNVFGGR